MKPRWLCHLCGASERISANPKLDFHAHYMAEHFEAPK